MRKRHYVLAAALIMGVLSITPYLVAYFFVGPSPLQGPKFQYFYQDSELVYLARMREVTEGYPMIASPAFYEYKSAQTIQQPYGEWLYAFLAFDQAGFLPVVMMITKFIFPAILFVLLFYTLEELLRNSFALPRRSVIAVTLFVTWLIVQGSGMIQPSLLQPMLHSSYIWPILSIWTRSVNPIFGALTMFGAMLLWTRLQGERRHWGKALAIGLLVGLSSAYFFSFVLSALFFLVVLSFAIGYREWPRTKELLLAGAVALAVNGGYFYHIFFHLSGGKGTSLEKNGLFYTHVPIVNKFLVIATIAFLFALVVKVWRGARVQDLFRTPWWRWSFAALVAGFVAYNLQTFLGFTIWPAHFSQYTKYWALIIILTSLLVVVYELNEYSQLITRDRLTKVVSGLSLLGILLVMILQLANIRSVWSIAPLYVNSQRYMPVVTWLSKQPHPDGCVVFTLETKMRMEQYINAYTPCDLYASYNVFANVPEERIMHDYVAYLRLMGVTPETLDAYVQQDREVWQNLFFTDWREKFAQASDPWLAAEAPKNELSDFFANTPKKIETNFLATWHIPLDEYLKEYKLDYLVVDTRYTHTTVDPSLFKLAYQKDGIMVYRLIR